MWLKQLENGAAILSNMKAIGERKSGIPFTVSDSEQKPKKDVKQSVNQIAAISTTRKVE